MITQWYFEFQMITQRHFEDSDDYAKVFEGLDGQVLAF